MRNNSSHRHSYSRISNRGFTLTEIIVVTAIMGLVLPVITTIIFSLLRQQVYIARLSEVKRQGDVVLDQVQATIGTKRLNLLDHTGITVCDTPEGQMGVKYLRDPSNNVTTFDFSTGILAYKTIRLSDGEILSSTPITNNRVQVKDFTIECIKKNSASKRLIQVKYEITSSASVSTFAGPAGIFSLSPEEEQFMKSFPSLSYSTFILASE